MKLEGQLRGHNGWVTQIAASPVYKNMLVSSSRDKTIILWQLDESGSVLTGKPLKSLHGHGHFVSDVVMSSDGQYALSGSWDKTLRLWDLNTGRTTRQFVSHTKDVLSVAFSADNRQIVSGSRDKKIKLWNTLAQCKHTIVNECHTDWVSTVRFSPSNTNPVIVSAGWDRIVKVWNLGTCQLKTNHIGHGGYINSVTVSPDGSLCALGEELIKMVTTFEKLVKTDGKAPDDLEKQVATAITELSQTNGEIKNQLSELYFVGAQQFEFGNKKCILIWIPVPQLRDYQKIHPKLVRELEKKMSGYHIIFIAKRRILQKPQRGKNRKPLGQKRPRSRTLTAVHEAILQDVVFPAEVVGKRTRVKLDGKQIIKVHLDKAQQTTVEHKVDTFSYLYKRLTGKEVVFEFPEPLF